MDKWEVNSAGEAIAIFILSLAIEIALVVLGLWLWKILVIPIFGLRMISFWEFIGLRILLKTFTGTKWSVGVINKGEK